MTIASFYYQTSLLGFFLFFFFNDTATTEIYTLSLHDALPICALQRAARQGAHDASLRPGGVAFGARRVGGLRSEEHTSELQSPCNLVCRLLLEKKKKTSISHIEIVPLKNRCSSCSMSSYACGI